MRQFSPSKDLPELNRWRALRRLRPLLTSEVPRMGLIIDGVGAGFLLRTETSTAMLDGFITCSTASMRKRYNGLTQVARALCNIAGDLGLQLGVLTQSRGIAKALQRQLGFRRGPSVLALSVDLNQEEVKAA